MSDLHGRHAVPTAIERLGAHGPFAPEREQLMLYGRFVGAWDVEWVAFRAGGEVLERRRGAWHFAWVLGGRGVLDVIRVAGAPPEEDGATLRCWDPQLGAWRVVFMSPGDGQFVTMMGRPEGDRIVQEIVDPPSGEHAGRWTFSEITDEAFLWQAEESSDGGRSWIVTHEIRATKRER
jgi:hypothetical protein